MPDLRLGRGQIYTPRQPTNAAPNPFTASAPTTAPPPSTGSAWRPGTTPTPDFLADFDARWPEFQNAANRGAQGLDQVRINGMTRAQRDTFGASPAASSGFTWDANDDQGSFMRLVQGLDPSSQTLVGLKDQLSGYGWDLENPNAMGITHKIKKRGTGEVYRVGNMFDTDSPKSWAWVGQGGPGGGSGGGGGGAEGGGTGTDLYVQEILSRLQQLRQPINDPMKSIYDLAGLKAFRGLDGNGPGADPALMSAIDDQLGRLGGNVDDPARQQYEQWAQGRIKSLGAVDDPARQQYDDWTQRRIANMGAVNDPARQQYDDWTQKRIGNLGAVNDPLRAQYDDMVQKRVTDLEGAPYTAGEDAALVAHYMNPLTQARDAALGRNKEQTSARGFLPSSGLDRSSQNSIEGNYEQSVARSMNELAMRAIGERQNRSRERLGLVAGLRDDHAGYRSEDLQREGAQGDALSGLLGRHQGYRAEDAQREGAQGDALSGLLGRHQDYRAEDLSRDRERGSTIDDLLGRHQGYRDEDLARGDRRIGVATTRDALGQRTEQQRQQRQADQLAVLEKMLASNRGFRQEDEGRNNELVRTAGMLPELDQRTLQLLLQSAGGGDNGGLGGLTDLLRDQQNRNDRNGQATSAMWGQVLAELMGNFGGGSTPGRTNNTGGGLYFAGGEGGQQAAPGRISDRGPTNTGNVYYADESLKAAPGRRVY